MSLVLGLGLEHFCPWPREGLSSKWLSLALASGFFCVLGLDLGFFFVSLALALTSSLVSSTPPLLVKTANYRLRVKFLQGVVIPAVNVNSLSFFKLFSSLLYNRVCTFFTFFENTCAYIIYRGQIGTETQCKKIFFWNIDVSIPWRGS